MDHRIIAISLGAEQDIVSARQRARQIAQLAGFAAQDQTRIATAVSEIARNAFRYATGGRVEFSLASPRGGPQSLAVVVTDKGSGIADLNAVLEGRYRSDTGMGMGLVGSRRLMDEYHIQTGPDGTRVSMAKYLPASAPKVTPGDVGRLAEKLAADPVRDALAEVQQQNRELLQALKELQEQHDELRKVTQQAQTLTHSLQEADARKDEFLATLAHELRNPLAPISASAALLQSIQRDAGGEVARANDIIARQAHHLTRLVDDLLDVARISRGKINLKSERVELGAAVRLAVETTMPFMQARQQTLHIDVPAAPIVVTGDAARLSQVIANLLHNASKYSAPDTGIRLTVSHVDDASARIAISDQGIGLTPQALQTVFDIFVQAGHSPDLPQSGLGIGLSLVRGIVEMHGGAVEAMSAGEGQGSTFVVSLPIAAATLPDATGRQDARLRPAAKRVLVVDDNADAADSIAALLEVFGHSAKTSYSPIEALDALRAFNPQAVLLDIGLPGKSGYEVVAEMRPLAPPGTLFIAMTGYGQEKDRQRAKAAGFDHHMLKPVDVDALEALLR